MPFKKQFPKESFLSALSSDWQKTSDIAKKVGCSRAFTTKTLLQMYKIVPVGLLLLPDNKVSRYRVYNTVDFLRLTDGRVSRYRVYNTVEFVEWKWVPGGKQGTREWRLKQ